MISRLRKLFRSRSSSVVIPTPDEIPEWTAEDAGRLRSFLTGPSGIKFGIMLRHLICRAAIDATSTPNGNTAWSCGRAAGIRETGEWVQDQARFQDDEEPHNDQGRPSDDLAWLDTPKAP